MEKELSLTSVGLFVLAVFPGLVSTTIYRLIMPARPQEWGSAVLQGLFYSTVNFVISLPVLFLLAFGYDPLQHPVRYCATALIVLVGFPVMLPIGFVRLIRSKRLATKIQIPYPTAWDSFFDRREQCFVLIHLKNGLLLGGYYGGRSYAGAFPNDGDIYLEAIYRLDAEGRFGEPVPDSRGALIRKDEYSYVELFRVPDAPAPEPIPGEQDVRRDEAAADRPG